MLNLDDLEEILLIAPLRDFRDCTKRGYFEDELIKKGFNEEILKNAHKQRRDIKKEPRLRGNEPLDFFFLKGYG